MIRVGWLAVLMLAGGAQASEAVIRVGAKAFTEQHILGEIVAQLIERHTDLAVERRFDLGGTGICHHALETGELDVYVEYTGTALVDILHEPAMQHPQQVYQHVARLYRERFDLFWLPPIGINNTFAIAVRDEAAVREQWRTISDLSASSNRLQAGFTSEFTEREDGYPGMARTYGLRFAKVLDLDPGLMYDALARGQVDVICAFATDSRIDRYGLKVLIDDRGFFPPYDAAPVIRGAALAAHPELREALSPLVRSIADAQMRELNAAVDQRHMPPAAVARTWVEKASPQGATVTTESQSRGGFLALVRARRAELVGKTLQHLQLTACALMASILIGVPLGILIHRRRMLARPVLSAAEIIQTVPSLAMLAFLFALYRMLGAAPAITALILYSLLPIILNTMTGLDNIPPETREAALGLGMSGWQRLRIVELPLALPVMMAGVRTAGVWVVGIATLSTYVGAGGLGDFISRGLARNDPSLTLLGAVPAAAIAILISCLVQGAERRWKWM